MADYTAEQYRKAARKAMDAGDTAAAKRLIEAGRALPPPDRGFGAALYDNVIGNPDDGVESTGERIGSAIRDNLIGVDNNVESPGEKLGSLIRGGTAGVARGLADVPALPANIAQLGARGFEKMTGMEQPSAVSRGLNKLPDTRDMLSSVPVIGPESEYVAPGKAGQFASTMGEFAGGAGGAGGAQAMVRYGAIPGAASEAAGQLTEGTSAEPYARTGAGIVAALMASPKPGAFSEKTEAGKMANQLQSGGVRNVTMGQAKGSQPLMSAEGRLQATSGQIDDFTGSIMRKLGSADDLATPSALKSVQDRLVKQMDDAVSGVDIVPDAASASRALAAADDYVQRVPAGQLTPRVRGIAEEIQSAAQAGKPVSLDLMKKWRSDIGRLSVSPDAATREAAHSVRGLINDMTDSALTAAGRSDDIASLAAARESYQNFVGVRDAASRAGAEGGTLSPQALNQSVIRSQGREAYATGQTTPMSEFTRAGASVLRPAPTVSPGGVRSMAGAVPVASATLMGGGALQAGADPITAALLASGAAMAPEAGKAFMRSNIAQQLMRNPGKAATQTMPVLPGLLSGSN